MCTQANTEPAVNLDTLIDLAWSEWNQIMIEHRSFCLQRLIDLVFPGITVNKVSFQQSNASLPDST